MIKEFRFIEDYPIDKLKEDPNNPNQMSKSDEISFEQSLLDRGLLGIILIDQHDVIVNGTHTVRKLKKAGNPTCPVLIKEYTNEIDKRIDRQILNYGPHGSPDKQKQVAEYLAIFNADKTEEFLKFMNKPKDEFLSFISNDTSLYGDSRAKKPSEKPKTKPGQIYKLGNHRVMCGDALEENDVAQLLESDNPRLLLTDPPYDLKKFSYMTPFFETYNDIEMLIFSDDHGTAKMILDYEKFFKGFYVIYFNSPSRYPNQPMMSHRLISHYRKGKSNFQNLRDAFPTIHEVALRKDGLVRQEKPLELPRKFISHYTKPEEQVLDLFGGSGSTMIACEQLGRNCLTMELDPGVVDAIVERYEELTHEKAILI